MDKNINSINPLSRWIRGIMPVSAWFLFFIFLPVIIIAQKSQDSQTQQDVQSIRRTWKNIPERIGINGERKQTDAPFSFIFQQDTSAAITVLRVLVPAGKKAEPVNQKGLAFLTSRLAVEIPENSKLIKLMTLGSSIAVDVEGDFSCITVTCLSENLSETVRIISAILREPLFSSLRISAVKKNMVHRQKIEEDHTELFIEREYLNVFFGNTNCNDCSDPGDYSGSIFGTKIPGTTGNTTSLKDIKKKDIENFYNTYFNRAHMTIVVSSDLSKDVIEATIEKHFLSLPPGQRQTGGQGWDVTLGGGNELSKKKDRILSSILNNEKKEHFFKKENTQALISVGALLPGLNPNHFACALMLENLVGGGVGSRIWPLRAEQNLAYTLNAKTVLMKDAGIIYVYLKTDNTRKEKALPALNAVLAELYKNGVGEAEFYAIKERTRAHFLRNNETKEMRTFYLGFFEMTGLGFEFFTDFFPALEAITPGEFNAYIRQVLNPGGLVKIMIGPG